MGSVLTCNSPGMEAFIRPGVLNKYLGPSHIIKRRYTTEFASINEFVGVQGVDIQTSNKADQEIAATSGRDGGPCHSGWLTGTLGALDSHRAYPAIQLYKYSGPAGTLSTFGPIVVAQFYVWTNIQLEQATDKEWGSMATFTCYADDVWARTVLVNVDYTGYTHLMHVPQQGDRVAQYEPHVLSFPTEQWVKMTIVIDLRGGWGSGNKCVARVYQDDVLVSRAAFDPRISDPSLEGPNSLVYTGRIAQMHFGLYAARFLTTANTTNGNSKPEVRNDSLVVYECDIP